jgi:hypothetical protein
VSFEDRPTGQDMRLVGENYCIDCPDPEACHQGAPCDLVRVTAEKSMEGARSSFVIIDETNQIPESVEAVEERLNRTNNVRVMDDPRGDRMPTSDQSKPKVKETKEPQDAKEPEVDYDQSEAPYKPQFSELKVRTWLAHVQPERLLAYGVLAAAAIGLARRKQPKRTRVDYHLYVHTEKEKDKGKK